MIGIFAVAFKMRDDEDELSANWLDYFDGDRPAKLTALLAVLRNSQYKPGNKSGLAIGIAGEVAEAAKRCNASVRIIHAPEDDNSAHAELRRWPRDNDDLFDILADEVWADLELVKNYPAAV